MIGPVDATTVILLDIDKTLLGARGRNDTVIDQARTAAMEAVCIDALGAAFDRAAFHEVASIHDIARLVEHVLPARNTSFHAAHSAIAARMTADDPTPFKAFRRREFVETVARMRASGGAEGVPDLAAEVVLTGEVLDVARRWQRMGALIVALSDKPDESAVPDETQRQCGYLPLHRTQARIVDSQGNP